jgi:hypothetical protein
MGNHLFERMGCAMDDHHGLSLRRRDGRREVLLGDVLRPAPLASLALAFEAAVQTSLAGDSDRRRTQESGARRSPGEGRASAVLFVIGVPQCR